MNAERRGARPPGRLLCAKDGRDVRLLLQDLFLGGRVTPAGARLAVRHVFASAEPEPVEAVYAFRLPRDAALRSFEAVGRDFRAVSRLRPAAEAEADYEDAMEQGRLAVLAREYKDGLVNLAVGNLRPGETVAVHLEILAGVESRDGGFRFRFPFTVSPVYLPDARFGKTPEGRFEMDLPPSFGGALMPPWAPAGSALHKTSFDLEVDAGAPVTRLQSPSHPLQVRTPPGRPPRASLAVDGDVPNRDLVLDAGFDPAQPSVTGAAGEFVAVIPSRYFGPAAEAAPRRIVFALDRSGSMSGEPIRQALRAVRACLGALGPEDRFSIVAFDTVVETPADGLLAGDRAGRTVAESFLEGVDARDGTELAQAVRAAAGIGGPETDVFVLTDGQVGETERILAVARRTRCRLHVLGIGRASQDRFLNRLARDSGGIGRFVTPSERVDRTALELFAAMSRAVAKEIRIRADGGETVDLEPPPPSAVFAGFPITVYGRTSPRARSLRVEWAGGRGSLELPQSADEAARETARLLRGARLVADGLPGRLPGEESGSGDPPGDRLARLSAEYGLASRAMSLVAVVTREDDRPGAAPKTMVVPVGLPEGLMEYAYFAQHASVRHSPGGYHSKAKAYYCCCDSSAPTRMAKEEEDPPIFDDECIDERLTRSRAARAAIGGEDLAMELAAKLEPDGGMPGPDMESRVAASLAAYGFLAGWRGIFPAHLGRLERFLAEAEERLGDPAQKEVFARLREGIRTGRLSSKDWGCWARRILSGESFRLRDLSA